MAGEGIRSVGWNIGGLSLVLDNLPFGVFVIDREFAVHFVNAQSLRILHRDRAEVIDRYFWDIVPHLIRSEVWGTFHQAVEQWTPRTCEYFSTLAKCWIEAKAIPLDDQMMMISMSDRTDVRESQNRMAAIADAVPAFIAYLDQDLTYRFCNAFHESYLGVSRDEIVGRPVWEVLGRAGYEEIQPTLDEGLRGETVYFSKWASTLVGRRFLQGTVVPALDGSGRTIGLNIMVSDETDSRQIAEDLANSERHYRQVTEGLPDLVWGASATGQRTYFNARWLEFTGVARSDGVDMLDLSLHPVDRNDFMVKWAQCVEEGLPYEGRVRLRGLFGVYRWFLMRAMPIRNADGSIAQWFGTCTDVHDLFEAERTLAMTNHLGQTLNREPDPVRVVQILTDTATKAIGAEFGSFFHADLPQGANPETFSMFVLSGAPKEAFASFPPVGSTPLFAATFRGTGSVLCDDVVADPRFTGMPPGHLPVKSYLAVSVRGRDGAILGGLFFGHRDVGMFNESHVSLVEAFAAQASVAYENASLYEQLRQANDGLEQIVEERTHELRTANEALQQFTHHVAHDLRAPVRAIVATSRMLQDDHGNAFGEDAERLINRQVDAGKKLGMLIDDLLDMAKVASQVARKRPTDITALAREAARECLTLYPDHSSEVNVADEMHGDADPQLLKLVLTNLIDNALKYSPSGKHVWIGREEVGFFVRDEGIGIDRSDFAKVFEAFTRVGDNRSVKGTGIGLSNVRKIVERHGGKVWVESELGVGSTFYFTLG